MLEILLAAYIGGIVATFPVAYGVRGTWAIFLILSVGWPLIVVGTILGVVKHTGEIEMDVED